MVGRCGSLIWVCDRVLVARQGGEVGLHMCGASHVVCETDDDDEDVARHGGDVSLASKLSQST